MPINGAVLLRSVLEGWARGVLLMWPALLVLGALSLAKVAYRRYERRRLSRSGVEEIDRMDGRAFEQCLEGLFVRLGFRVERTQYRGDYGGDLITQKDGAKTVVQAKRSRHRVGVKAVQEAVAAKGYYHCSRAMVVSNNFYTRQAAVLARANDVALWDRHDLVRALLSVAAAEPAGKRGEGRPGVSAAPVEVRSPVVMPEALGAAACARCGKPVSERVREYCRAHAGRFGGQVYCYEHQRSVRSEPASPSADRA